MPTAINTTALIHLYEPAKEIGKGERKGAAFRGYHKTKVKSRSSDQWEDHFTSVGGSIWGKEAEWILRDSAKGSLVLVSGIAHVETWEGKDGKAGAGLRIDAQTARILDRKQEGEQEAAPQAEAPRKVVKRAATADEDSPPF